MNVPRRRLLRGGTTEAATNLSKRLAQEVGGEAHRAHWVLRGGAKELNILNPTIKIGVRNDVMTLEADTKLVEDALGILKLVGSKRRRFARGPRIEE